MRSASQCFMEKAVTVTMVSLFYSLVLSSLSLTMKFHTVHVLQSGRSVVTGSDTTVYTPSTVTAAGTTTTSLPRGRFPGDSSPPVSDSPKNCSTCEGSESAVTPSLDSQSSLINNLTSAFTSSLMDGFKSENSSHQNSSSYKGSLQSNFHVSTKHTTTTTNKQGTITAGTTSPKPITSALPSIPFRTGRTLHFVRNSSCQLRQVLKHFKVQAHVVTTVIFDMHKTNHSSTWKACRVGFTGPKKTVFSVVLLEQGCASKSTIFLTDLTKHTATWVSDCTEPLYPEREFVNSKRRVYIDVGMKTGAGSHRVVLNVLAVRKDRKGQIHVRHLTPSQGFFVITKRIEGGYEGNHEKWAYLAVPPGNVLMISVYLASFRALPRHLGCEDRLELYSASTNTTVWTLCSHHDLLPPPHVIHDSGVYLHFVSAPGTVFDEYGSNSYAATELNSLGFRLLFSFHRRPVIPQKVDDTHWNCSVPHWPDFKQHVQCNLVTECAGGEDETDCSYSLCGDRSVLIKGTCYSWHKSLTRISWHEANVKCSHQGGRLASLQDPGLKEELTSALRLDFVHWVMVGFATAVTDLFLYRNVHQWADGNIAFFTSVQVEEVYFTAYGVLIKPNRDVIMFLSSVYNMVEFCHQFTCQFLCERTLKPSNDIFASHTQTNMAVKVRAPTNTSSLPFPHVQCPKGHVTHSFLAFDVRAACYDPESLKDDCRSEYASSELCNTYVTSFLPFFLCDNEVERIPYTLVCDYRQDCQDNSDESFCVFPRCNQTLHFQCHATSECLPLSAKCNKVAECADASDESTCMIHVEKQEIIEDFFDGTRYLVFTPPYIVDLETETGFPNITEVTNTSGHYCPETHLHCPSDGNCVPVYVRCNGVSDCRGHEDEAGCTSYICLRHYRCRGSTVCVHPSDVCDGIPHCPQHDDERFCSLSCPQGCTCQGHAALCPHPFPAHDHTQLRYLDARGSGLIMEEVKGNEMLTYLDLARCNLTSLDGVLLPNLRTLILDDNRLEAIAVDDLLLLPNLLAITLAGNPISELFLKPHSRPVAKLQNLDLSRVRLPVIDVGVFSAFPVLQTLNVSESGIETVERRDAQGYLKTLRVLDIRACPVTTFPRTLFHGLDELEAVFADNYKLCCPAMFPQGLTLRTCEAPFDEVSSCDNLLRSDLYRVALSVLASLVLVSNFVSFVVRVCQKMTSKRSSFSVFALHLCMADFLMGAYLVFIGVADRVYMGSYLWQDVAWRNSVACKVAGFLSMVACEVSAFIICIIIIDRFLVLRFPFSPLRFSFRSAQFAAAIAWSTGAILALVPLLPVTSHWRFYSQNGICIPLPVNRSSFPGHSYAFGTLIVLNFVLFLFIAVGQALIYASIQSNRMSGDDSSRQSQDAAIARRLTAVVVSDFLCWFPIGLLGLLASNGTPISGEVNVAMAVFVLPLNSALNPFLYTLNMIQEHMRKKKEDMLFRKLLLLKDQRD